MLTDAEKVAHNAKRRTSRVTAKARPAATMVKPKAGPKTFHGRAGSKVKIKSTVIKKSPYVKGANVFISYDPGEGVSGFVEKIRGATPMQLVDVERKGVGGRLLKDIALKMDIPTSRFFNIIGVPKATAEKKASGNQVIAGAGGQAALGMVRLLGIAKGIVDNSTADEARGFDAAKWFGRWIEQPQPALGGKKPAELLDTPTGVEVVSRLLGAMESGAYL